MEHNHTHEHTHEHSHEHGEGAEKSEIIKLTIGAILFAIGFVLFEFVEASLYITLPILVVAYIILGAEVVISALKNIVRGKIFDENFLMALATVGAFATGEYPEAVAVMLFYQIGEFFQDAAVDKSRKSINSLLDIRPDTANLLENNETITVHPSDVNKEDIIVVKPGERVPLDGIVIGGTSFIDTRALTGESVPRTVTEGDTVLSGCINQSGLLTVKVTKEFSESTASKIIDLVENATSKKAPAENFITKFARYYTPVVVIAALLLATIPPLFANGVWADWIYRGFVFLVISCPCALVISIPLTFFGGLGAASRKGVLIKGSNYLEALNSLENIVFDKTGTLTKGVFEVTDICPASGFSKEELLEIAASVESMSNHPIAKSVVEAAEREARKDRESQVTEFSEIPGHGVSAVRNGKTILAGNAKLMEENNISYIINEAAGTKVYIAVDNTFAGSIVISDEVKEDSKNTIEALKKLGVKNTVMLTGDNENIAKSVAEALNLDKYFAELLPADKVTKLEELMTGTTAFVGDGINDAPVLARADIGIAMGALGSDAAIEAADIVLMTDEPSKLIDAVSIAKKTRKIVVQNIVFALAVKAVLLLLGALGFATMWLAIFGDVGVMLLAVLNGARMLKTK